MYTNFHSHCTFCDGRESMEEFVKFAIAKGLKKYGFSSHAPIPFHTSWTMNADDYPDYEKEFYRLKQKYSPQIELYLGLEIDYIPQCTSAKSDFFSDKKLDYAIGSVHYLDPLSDGSFWSIDGPYEEFETGINELFNGDIEAATARYYEVLTEMLYCGGFDIVGHFDKITMHGSRFASFDIHAGWYKQLVYDFLKVAVKKKYLIEVNTKAFITKGITYPDNAFFPLLKELDIPVIVNSDCHYPDKITAGFPEAYAALYNAGIKEVYQLSGAGWEPVDIRTLI